LWEDSRGTLGFLVRNLLHRLLCTQFRGHVQTWD